MKKAAVWILVLCTMAVLVGCGRKKTAVSVAETIDGSMKTYCKMSDGTWKCGDFIYKYRLEISGRMPNAVKDTTFVYLSNMKKITFEQAYKAGGVSSYSEDYFQPQEAVLVEMKSPDTAEEDGAAYDE